MASPIQMNITGLKELGQALKQLPDNVGKNVLRGAVRAGAKVLTDAIIAKAPLYSGPDKRIIPGIIKKSVYMKHIDQESNVQHQVFFVSVRKGKKQQAKGMDAFYWTWVEFGHHVVPRVAKGGAKLSVRRAAVTSGSSIVSGAQYVLPHPFFRPAFEATKEQSAKAIREYLATRIPLEAAKLGR